MYIFLKIYIDKNVQISIVVQHIIIRTVKNNN